MQNTSRLTIAVSMTAALMLGGIGVAGLASAGEESPLTTLSLPEPRAGDEARYDYIQIEGGLDDPVITDGPLDGMTIAFRSPRISYDKDGAPHMVNSFYELTNGYYQLNGDDQVRWNKYADWTLDIDVVDGQVVAYWMKTGERVEELDDGRVAVYSQGGTQFNEHYGTEFSPPYGYPCFTFNVFQGRPTEILGPMELHGDNCKWLRKEGSFGDGLSGYIPVGIETFGDIEAVHFVQDSPIKTPQSFANNDLSGMRTGGTHVWLSSDYPYPVKIAHPMDDVDDRYDVYVMREFFRGEEPLATAADAVDVGDSLLVDKAPLTFVGPDASSITEGFTAMDAWDAALADPDLGLQDFLDDHPDAYTGRVHHDTRDREDRGGTDVNRTDFRFHVTAGGTTTLVFNVREEVRTTHDAFGNSEEPVVTVTVEETDPDTNEFPDPAVIPEEYPTIGSTADLWRRFGGHDRQENTYEFSIWCGGGCDEPSYQVVVGHAMDWSRDEFQPDEFQSALGARPAAADSYQEDDVIELHWFNERLSIGTSQYRVEVRDKEPAQALEPDSEPVLTKSALSADSVWDFPPVAAVAGIGAGSLLIGSVFAGWPALKGGFLAPLFSRVHRGQALEHPLRRRLMEIVNANPGIHLQAIVELAGEPRSTVLHHMRTLEHTDMVAAEHTGHYTCYFSKDRAARLSMKAAPAVKARGAQSILGVVSRSPGLSIKAAAQKAGLSLSTAYYHVRRLKAAGLLDLEEGLDGMRLAITSTGRATLREVLPTA